MSLLNKDINGVIFQNDNMVSLDIQNCKGKWVLQIKSAYSRSQQFKQTLMLYHDR